MALTNSGRIISDVRVYAVSGRPAMGGYLLLFSLEFSIQAWPDGQQMDLFVERLKVEVECPGTARQWLGIATPERSTSLRTTRYSSKHHMLFELPITKSQLSAIEEARDGSDAIFFAKVQGYSEHEKHREPAEEDLRYPINQKGWIDILHAIGAAKVVLFEMQIPDAISSTEFRGAASLLERAQHLLRQGEYEDSVGCCRRVLEAVARGLGDDQAEHAASEAYVSRRKAMTKPERILLLRRAVRHFTHPSHHAPEDTEPSALEPITRSEATLVVAASAAILANALTRGSHPEET